jgi:transcriptional regulator with XRE-family HTH domain
MSPTPTLGELRRAAGLSQVDLAVRAQVSLGTIRLVDRGYRPRHPYIRRALADALGVTVDDLFPPAREAATDAH